MATFKKHLCFYILFILLYPTTTVAGDSIIAQYVPPMDIPLFISGNFGDVRSSSFHFGIDFRTQEKTGWPVYAIADGYVARVKVEPGGYGKAIYIVHDNGTMSVYAHLERYCDTIAKFVVNEQYAKKSFYQDIVIPEYRFRVKQCDIIGFSGNAGQSSGPHLHFELRDNSSQNILNCLVPTFPIIDNISPVIKRIWIYNSYNYVDEKGLNKKSYNVLKKSSEYQIEKSLVMKVPSSFMLGIEAFDNISDSDRKYSFFSSKIYIDTTLVFYTQFDEMQFDQNSMVNAFIDYNHKLKKKENVYHQFLFPNQELLPVKYANKRGEIFIDDSLIHDISIELADISGNKSLLKFKIQLEDTISSIVTNDTLNYLRYNVENKLENESLKAVFPANSLFSNVCVGFKKVKVKSNILSDAFSIGDKSITTKKPFKLFFPVSTYSDSIKKKLVVVNVDENDDINSIGGELKNNELVATTKSFGVFGIAVDTTPPRIVAMNILHRKNMKAEKCIKFKITDELSGIAEYKGFIDNKWVLFEYDQKSNLLTYIFDKERIAFLGQNHHLKLIVTDKRNNKSTLSMSFFK